MGSTALSRQRDGDTQLSRSGTNLSWPELLIAAGALSLLLFLAAGALTYNASDGAFLNLKAFYSPVTAGAAAAAVAHPAMRLLRLIPATLADAGTSATAAARSSGDPAGGGALTFAVAAGVRDEFSARLAGAPALVLPVDCPDAAEAYPALRDSPATCRVIAGVCAALAAADFEFLAVAEPADAWLVDAGAFAGNASPPLPRGGLYRGPMHRHSGVPSALQAVWPRVYWPLMAAPYFVLSRDVAAALCAMHESGLPLKLFGPPSYWASVALRTMEGLTYVDSGSGKEVETWPAAHVPTVWCAPRASCARSRVDIVLVIPNPWQWADRRRAQFEAFLATQRRVKGAFTAKLIFVMGSDGLPGADAPDDAAARAHPDVIFVTAPACPDLDTYERSRWDGQTFPPTNSSTTCKVLEGIAVASERFDFSFLARVGDDAYFRWDYFLRERAAALPRTGLYMGSINSNQRISRARTREGRAHFFSLTPRGRAGSCRKTWRGTWGRATGACRACGRWGQRMPPSHSTCGRSTCRPCTRQIFTEP